MGQLQRAGQSGAIDVAANQAAAMDQLATLVDMMRQVAGNAAVLPGSGGPMDPLNAPFTLYVNPYIGSDKFVGGSYNTHEASGTDEEIIAQKLKRVELQRLECGYTPQRPFKTINRACIEAAIITSKNWYTYTDPRAHVDCVSIVLSPGVHTLITNEGSSSTSIASWGTSKDPTVNDLIAFNPTSGGVLLPRGCSLCGPDLRKATIRPSWVPAPAAENADYSNRRGMLKITGTGYFFGFTVMDKVGFDQSHHLLDAFHFASKAELDAFYAKCRSAVGTGADLSNALTVTRGTEYQIVGPIDQTQAPTSAWDTTASASPYIFNCSVRSDYGLGGAFMDGSKVEGLKSMVCANFTGVSLQKDMSCWQRYDGTAWTTTTYEQYINADPDNVRMDPARMSRHISAINDAFIQEVSVFAIGHGIHHFTDRGGEITVTNSNSSFGGCAAYSKGYKNLAFPIDRNWSISGIKVPLGIQYKTGNVRFIYLGTTEAVTNTTVTLSVPLAADSSSQNVPAQLLADGYSLRSNTRIWIENPLGTAWSAVLTSAAWDANTPDRINITAPGFGGQDPTTIDSVDENGNPIQINALLNKRIYIRRLVDTRTPAERRIMLLANNTASARLPQRNFILQTDPARTNGAISGLLNATNQVLAVSTVGIGSDGSVATSAEFTVRDCAPSMTYSAGQFYPAGTTIKRNGKHLTATRDVLSAPAVPDSTWVESFVHTASEYNAEDPIRQEGRIITIDTDTDQDANSQTLNINFNSEIQSQYRASTDYRGVYRLLRALGFSDSAAHNALLPQPEADRLRDPASAADFPVPPSGGAATGLGNWAVEFRRPSVLRLYGHAWEWAGFLNYSKSIPAAQKDLSAQNLFTYYFTNEAGGRVVPQGSNENGFNVTPQGLEDIETGTTLSVENVGSSGIDIGSAASYPRLDVGELTVQNLTVNGRVDLPDVGKASTTETGPVELANIESLKSTAAAATDADINGDSENVVTVKGLNRWKLNNGLVSARSGVQRVFVDPVSTQSTSISAMLSDPPLSADKAVRSLSAAAAYANEAYGPTTVVEFLCKPGLYIHESTSTITFKTVTRIRAWNGNTTGNLYLNDFADGPRNATGPLANVIPFDYQNFDDPLKQPTFLTKPGMSIDASGFCITNSNPTTFIFEQDAEVVGICWWGVMTTISAKDGSGNPIVPDSFFPSGTGPTSPTGANSTLNFNWRKLALADPDNALNYFIREHAVKVPGDNVGYYYGHRIRPVMEFMQTGRVNNIAIGALSPAEPQLPGNSDVFDPIIRCSAGLVRIAGLALVGNCKISSEVNLNVSGDKDYSTIRLRFGGLSSWTTAAYFYTGWAVALFGSRSVQLSRISIVFGGSAPQYEYTGLSDSANWNQKWNNIHLLNNSLQVATSTSEPTTGNWKTLGPALFSVIGAIQGTSRYSERNWSSFRIIPGSPSASNSGFNGKFGLFNRLDGLSYKVRGSLRPRTLESFGFLGEGRQQTIFQVAGTGVVPSTDTTGLDPGEVSDLQNFDDLNMQVYVFRKGVDIVEATNYERDFVL